MSERIKRVNELIKQEISKLLCRELDFGNILVTVLAVSVSPDLRQAKVIISILPSEKEKNVQLILKKNIFDLQQILNKRLKMRPVPKICFEINRTASQAQRIEEILEKIKGS